MVSMPRQITAMLISQKAKKQIHRLADELAAPGHTKLQHGDRWPARRSRFECRTSRRQQARAEPRERSRRALQTKRARTPGTECHNCVPACALSSIGMSTIRLPSRMVPMACYQSHASGDQAGGEHVGRDANAHRDPERGVVVDAPGALLGRHGREVVIVERGIDLGEIQLGKVHVLAPWACAFCALKAALVVRKRWASEYRNPRQIATGDRR